MDMTIEEYLQFVQHLLEQAEDDGFEMWVNDETRD